MRQLVMQALRLCALCAALAGCAYAQTPAPPAPNPEPNAAATLNDVQQQLQAQRAEIERLQAALDEQGQLLKQLLQRAPVVAAPAAQLNAPAPAVVTAAVYQSAAVATTDTLSAAPGRTVLPAAATAAATPQPAPPPGQTPPAKPAPKPTEILTGALSSLSFSGDVRLRYETLLGQLNAAPNSANPAVLGNELTPRNRLRVRVRFAVRGQFGRELSGGEREFQWGLRLATEAGPDINSGNETLTDFFSRKPFSLDQAYVTYKPARVPGLRLQGGKFALPWVATELTIDTDIQPEGLNESYTRNFKNAPLKNLTFVAWQLPFLERSSAFVLGPDGRVNVAQSRRAGRDLALYGAQVRAQVGLTPTANLTLSAADLYYSGTQFINVAQFFGGQFQVPVTVTLPATATSPAQTVTAVVNIPRDALVSGNANVGVSAGNTNAVNRDGRLSSGYNLVDLIARLDLTRSRRLPVMLLLNYVHNTQAHSVVVAGPGGANRLLPNHENDGFWAEVQAGQSRARGDLLFDYAFIRIEKDAVLTPFNFSDLLQPSDVRAHRLSFTYTVDPRVLLTLTGIASQRPNGLLGAFGQTPPGSLNRATTRLQFDTVFRF